VTSRGEDFLSDFLARKAASRISSTFPERKALREIFSVLSWR